MMSQQPTLGVVLIPDRWCVQLKARASFIYTGERSSFFI